MTLVGTMHKALLILLSVAAGCAAETPPPRSAGPGSAPGPVTATRRPAPVDLCRRLARLYACHARTLPAAKRAVAERSYSFMIRLTRRMPYATAQNACQATLVGFARGHAKTPGMARCIHPGAAGGVPGFARRCKRVEAAIRCYSRGRPPFEQRLAEKYIRSVRQIWSRVPVEAQPYLCRKHFLSWSFVVAKGGLGRCRPTDPSLREEPMPAPPANLQPECRRYLASYRCLMKHSKGASLWRLRNELREALRRWHSMPHLLPRLCVLSAVRLKMILATAKLTNLCPKP